MSRYKVFIFQFLFFLPVLVGAEERSLQQARDLAYDFMTSRVQTKATVIDLKMVYDGEMAATKSSADSPAYYVFNNESGPGFVIVSGDDCTIPVLGYSDTFNFKSEGIPSNLCNWLETMRSQVFALRDAGVPAYAGSTDVGTDVVSFETALWDQGKPYFNDCPLYNGQRCLTGCGPTAIAIAMRYREWPDRGVGTTPQYYTITDGFSVSPRTLGDLYDWDDMPLTDGRRSSWTDPQKTQVSRLIADVGAALEADYGVESTGVYDVDVPGVLAKFMKYDKTISCEYRGFYTDEEWYSLVKTAFNDGPIVYSGSDDTAGHMFVLDGYTTKDYYHVNWGWGGVANGYYLLDAMNPSDQGYGANELGMYNQFQSMILNMKKDEGGKVNDCILMDGWDETTTGMADYPDSFEVGVQFSMRIGFIYNAGIEDYTGKIAVVLVDKNKEPKEFLAEFDLKDEPLAPEYGYSFSKGDLNFTITESIEIGDAIICMYYDTKNSTWKHIRGNKESGVVDIVYVTDAQTIEESTTLKYDNDTRTITLTTKDGVEISFMSSTGKVITPVAMGNNEYVIDVSAVTGHYYLELTKGEELKTVVIDL